MPGNLFTGYFLTDGIKATPEWRNSVAAAQEFEAFREGVRQRYDALTHSQDPNEAVTEQELIRPVLELLGWVDYLPQQGTTRNEDIPDHLLFPDAGSKERATVQEPVRKSGTAMQRRWKRASDSDCRSTPVTRDDRHQPRTPHGQIIRYLSTAEAESESRIRWGILTNGGVWRLYDYRARPRATSYFEADLGQLLEDPATPTVSAPSTCCSAAIHLPRRTAPRPASWRRRWPRADVTNSRWHRIISAVVFERAFPSLVRALAENTQYELAEIREAALVFLYRLFFVLYAEDRGLLPVHDARYEDYGLRRPVREDIARRMRAGTAFSAQAYALLRPPDGRWADSSTRATLPSGCRLTTAACSTPPPLRSWLKFTYPTR